jgi:hypothetical protein
MKESFLLTLGLIASCVLQAQEPIAYYGMVQKIPGKIQCEFYNRSGEGLAYHDKDSINNGSGKLNPPNGTYLNEFRMKEGVDISYTKGKGIDDSPFNKVVPEIDQLYVGWTEPGEWIKYQVDVKTSGIYNIDLMYTANGDGIIAIDVDGVEALKSKIPTTFDAADTIAWRQWHHWNKAIDIGKVELKKGRHIITLRTVEHGNMNFDFLEFKKAKKK